MDFSSLAETLNQTLSAAATYLPTYLHTYVLRTHIRTYVHVVQAPNGECHKPACETKRRSGGGTDCSGMPR